MQVKIITERWPTDSREYAGIKISENDSNNQNLIHEEVKGSLNLDKACHHSVQKCLSSHLQSKNIKIKIYKL
jgi:hypothetical protein